MPELIEQIQKLSQKIKLLSDSQVTEQESKGFATRADELSKLSIALSVPTRRLEGFISNGIEGATSFSTARELKGAIDEMVKKYDSDPRSILTPDPNWRHDTKSRLEQLAGRLNDQLLVNWSKYVSDIKPTVDQGLMVVFRSSPTYANHANRINELSSALDQLANRLPRSQEEIDQPTNLASEMRRAIENLPDDIPEPVRELFMAITRRTATPRHLTDEAFAWLRDKEMLDAIQLSWKQD